MNSYEGGRKRRVIYDYGCLCQILPLIFGTGIVMKRLSFGLIGLLVVLGAAPFDNARAADMALKAPPLPAPVADWTGWYVGGNAGTENSRNSLSTQAMPTPDASLGVVPGVSEGLAALSTSAVPVGSASGFIGGGQVGYNQQFANFVTGLEADIQGIAASGGNAGSGATTTVVVSVPVTSTQTASMETKYLGTVRGRLGFLATPTLLVYGTGGLAYGGVNATSSLSQNGTNGFVGNASGTLSDTRAGWALGGGLEWMFAQKWSAKFEYFHYDLGTASFVSSPSSTLFATPVYQSLTSSAHFYGDVIRAGANFHF